MSSLKEQRKLKSLIWEQNLAGHELSEVLSGPDADPSKPITVHKNSISLSRKGKAKGTICPFFLSLSSALKR